VGETPAVSPPSAGGGPLRVLCLEDSPPDAELVSLTLSRAGYELDLDWAADRAAFEALLAGAPYDVILADYALPGFDAHGALALARAASPGTPFICVSGTIGEEATVELLKRGADDIVLKDKLARLPFSVQRAVDEAARRRELGETEAALRESQERERFALQGTNDGLWDVQMDSGAVYLSPRGCELLGYRPEEMATIAETWDQIVCPDDMPATLAALEAYLQGRTPIFDVEQRLRTASGEWQWMRTRGAAVARDANGAPTRMVGTHSDISKRKLAEKALAESERRFRSLFENLLNGYAYCRMIYDAAGAPVDFVYLEVNPAFELLTGLKDVVGRPVSEVIPGIRALSPDLFEVYGRVARTGAPETIELDFKSLGAWQFIAVYSTEPGTFIAVFEDITERREAERALRRQEEDIRRAYVDVLDAVTGGKLILLTGETLAGELGQPLSDVMPIRSTAELAEARRMVVDAAELRYPGRIRHTDLLSPVCEALNNALKHARGGTYQVFARDDCLQVAITDEGPGIDFRTLPRATLVRGFSTAASLGMGFTIMLQLCARVLLCTRPGRTEVVLEVAAADRPAPRG